MFQEGLIGFSQIWKFQISVIPAKFSSKNMRFEPVLRKIWRNLERLPKAFPFSSFFPRENLEKFEFEAVQRYVNLGDLEQ